MKKKVQILTVDDDIYILKSIERRFKYSSLNKRAELTCVTGVDEAVKALNKESYSVVITDMLMPERSGRDLVDILLKSDKPPYIIIMTGSAIVKDAVEYLKQGVYHYMEKPLNFDEMEVVLERIFKDIEKQKTIDSLEKEITVLRKGKSLLITAGGVMNRVLNLIESASENDFPVLILGESGTGKEVVADAIHYSSSRNNNPFIKVNSAGLVSSLLESEMFGYEKGAFTGASSSKPGKFELADSGTLFLDEIGDMELTLQAKLLRVLQDGTFERVGGTKNLVSDARIIAATNQNLTTLMEEKKFREDLFYRLNIITINLPPLRERKEDVPLLVNHFLQGFAEKYKRTGISFQEDAMDLLCSYHYPGNVRELENIVARSFALSRGEVITPHDLPEHLKRLEETPVQEPENIRDWDLNRAVESLEKKMLTLCLKEGGEKGEMAKKLGISRRQFYYKLNRYGLM